MKIKGIWVAVILIPLFVCGAYLSCFAQTKPIKLLFASFTGERAFMSDGIKAFAKDLEERSGGRIKVEFSWNQALGKIPEYYDLTVKGVCDVGFFNPVQCAKDVFLMASISTLPFVFPTAEIHTKALLELKKKGLLDKALDDDKIKLLFIAGDAGSALLTYKKPVRKLSDAKGLKLHIVPGLQVALAEAMEAVPVDMAGAEVYMALQTGTIDGHFKGYSPLPNFKWCEVTKYVTEPKLGSVFFAVAMNRKSYERLPKDIQKLVDEMAQDPKYSYISAKQMDDLTEAGRQCLKKHGVEFLEWESDSLEELGRRLKPVWEKWIADREVKGLPAKEALRVMYTELQKGGVKVPAVGYRP
uniref:TRAP transporter substrate-binding protein n=1 Tax=candidate division WOR-3 bacterium TaxID=2052148 RepID=A0A7C2K1Q6_UNCW3